MSILFPAETERIVFPVHRYDAICVRTALFYFRIKILRNLPIGKLTVKSDGNIEYQIGMCRSLHHTKIVHSNLRSRLFRKLSHDFARGNAHFVRLRIGKAYGIHMNDEVYPAIFKEISLDIVYSVMRQKHILVRVHLDMDGRVKCARSVAVNDKIMHAENAFIRTYRRSYIGDECAIRSFAEKGVGGFTDKLEPEDYYIHGDRAAEQSVSRRSEHGRKKHSGDYRCGCDNVSDAVGCGGFERHGIYSVAEPAVKECQKHFDCHRNHHYDDRRSAQRTFALSREQLFRRTLKKLKSEHGYDHGDKESAKVLHSRMSERMLTVGGLSGEDVSDKNKSGRSRVRQVIYRIGDDRNTARYKTECKLGCKKNDIDRDSDTPGDSADGKPSRVSAIFIF